MNSEKQLIRQMQNGDAQAFARFVDSHGPRVHALARRYARCEADAEDITQEVFIALHKSIGSFRGESALSTWVYRIAMNHCLKAQGRTRAESLPLDETLPLAAPDNPARQAEQSELSAQINDALATLSLAHRDVVILHEMHGLTYAECADALGVPVGTVKSRLFHAFGRLRERLGGYVRGDDEVALPSGPSASAAVLRKTL